MSHITTTWLLILESVTIDEIFVYKNVKLKGAAVNEILGVILNRQLICKKAGNKLNTLTIIANVSNPFQNNTLFKFSTALHQRSI